MEYLSRGPTLPPLPTFQGGLSGGEAKDKFWRVVRFTAAFLPQDKPRYCMGVG